MVSLLLLLALVALFYLIPYGGAEKRFTDVEILEAFGHPALIAICSLMILGRGLTMTGAMEPAVRACETHRLPGIENTDARQLRDLAGGMLTSIGTSTNLLVLNIASDLGMPRMGLFDFTTQPWRREGAVDSES